MNTLEPLTHPGAEAASRVEEADKHMALMLSELKPAINNFLWQWLPAETSMKEADEIACELYVRIKDAGTDTRRPK